MHIAGFAWDNMELTEDKRTDFEVFLHRHMHVISRDKIITGGIMQEPHGETHENSMVLLSRRFRGHACQ